MPQVPTDKSPAVIRRSEVNANVGDVIGRENARSHREVKDAVKKLRAIGGLDILSEMMGITATRVAQDTYQDPNNPAAYLTEQRRAKARPAASADGWMVQVVIKESAGKEMTRYRVRNVSINKTVPTDFRHENTAALVAACINESGNVNDPRVKRVIQLSEQETALIKEINAAKRLFKSVPAGNVKKRTVLENEIELNRLKLENVRLKLGA